MDGSRRYSGVIAKMPGVSGRLLCDWKRDRDLDDNCDICSQSYFIVSRGRRFMARLVGAIPFLVKAALRRGGCQ